MTNNGGYMLSAARHHILIIDDAPEDQGSLTALLQQHMRVSIATGGRQGFHRAQALLPDLILLDVFMPGMDGFATCRLLQESTRTSAIPIIFLTSASQGDQRLQGLTSGGVDYVIKPCLPAEVLARIRIHLSKVTAMPAAEPSASMPSLSQGEITLRAAMRVINDNLATLPPLADIAHQVGTHDKRLSAIFRQHLGMTVFAWIREQRLRAAREWLACSPMSIQDIAAEIGFHSAANFATAFRKRMGVTPSQYRTNLQQSQQSTPDAS